MLIIKWTIYNNKCWNIETIQILKIAMRCKRN